jgi:hypothetical protein
MDYEKLGVFYLGREYDAKQSALKDDLVLYDSKDLTTHAVCVGMTGSGKTGLCLALLEEAAIDGVPAICIDPKGDIANLLLTFPNLAPEDFAPWVDPAEARRKGVTVEAYAAQTADMWKKGLAEWNEPPARIMKFRDSTDIAIYTPGAETGLPLSVLRSFAPPTPELLADSTALRDRVSAVVSGLLNLLGRDADPVQSREHILLANILERAWREGTGLDMAALIAAVQKPPLDKVGAFDLETFFPAKDRMQLAMAINNLLASPGFAAWMSGEPLDAQRLLFTPEGKPRISIISIAHLPDPERMFIVTLVLNELIAWMRVQSGTASLRAIFYMDEIFGYFPPSANPPSKTPMLTLLKQGRAFGLGCVLATQNPVDLDYKGLGNAGTWLVGRLQTDRDKLRVLDGLESALAGAGNFDRTALDRMMSALTQRVFLMRNVHEDAAILMKSRWALSYLRGPLTGAEIARVMAVRKSAAGSSSAGVAAPTSAAPATAAASGRPALVGDVSEYFLPASSGSGATNYRPEVMGLAKLHFVDSKLALDQWQTTAYLAPLSDDGKDALWAEARTSADLKARLSTSPEAGASFGALPGPAMRAASYSGWSKTLASHLYESARAEVLVCDALKQVAAPGESEGDFRARLALKVREQRDAQTADLRQRYSARLVTLQDQIRRAGERVEREKSQLTQQKMQTAISVGATILGAFLGRKAVSVSNIGRATTAVRSASRLGRESGDVDRAGDSVEILNQRLVDLQAQLDAEIAALGAQLDPATIPIRSVQITPRKSDIAVGEVALVWTPWRAGADGFPAPAYS